MGEVLVNLATASICFLGQCYPALIGKTTPEGEFKLQQYRIEAPGYGGDVLGFARDSSGGVYAIHRVWTQIPKQRRAERLKGPVQDRVGITGGCINVDPEVYQKLIDCCSKGKLTIK